MSCTQLLQFEMVIFVYFKRNYISVRQVTIIFTILIRALVLNDFFLASLITLMFCIFLKRRSVNAAITHLCNKRHNDLFRFAYSLSLLRSVYRNEQTLICIYVFETHFLGESDFTDARGLSLNCRQSGYLFIYYIIMAHKTKHNRNNTGEETS